MTKAETMKAIKALGLNVVHADGEYEVTYKGLSEKRTEATAYYTTDAEDALGTARHMASRKPR